jgi:dihydrofolate synthase / folylpolyglutamate synthase
LPSNPDVAWQQFCRDLFSRNEHTIKLGLDRVRAALRRLGHPERAFRVCTIAGTNGKGTAAALTAWWLARAGVRTGLYTSPHLLDFTERFRVDGRPADRAAVMAAGRTVLDAGADLTFFEVTTLIALVLFRDAGVEVAVLEVGLGGRLDAVNAVEPDVVGITSIALDHAAYLGDTLSQVAAEKAGVMRAGVPVVVATQGVAAGEVLSTHAAELGAIWIALNPAPREELPDWLRGVFADNVAVARSLAVQLGVVDLDLEGFRWPGRRDTWLPGFVLDVAHNPAGARGLADHLGAAAPPLGILGLSADKDAVGIAAALAPLPTRWVLTRASSPRAMDCLTLEREASELDVLSVVPTVADALALTKERGAPVLVTGSVYVMGDLLHALGVGAEFFTLSRRRS